MSLNTQVISSDQVPWVPESDFDISQPIKLEIWGRGGDASGTGTGGRAGGSGGGYGCWDAVTVTDPSLVAIEFANGSQVSYTDEGGNVLAADWGNAGSGKTGGVAPSLSSVLSDIAPDVEYVGGAGGDADTLGGGGGGEAASPSGNGNAGSPGALGVGGAGGTGTAGADGGKGGDSSGGVDGANGTAPGGGGGGRGTGGASGGTGGAGLVHITYTQLPASMSVPASFNPNMSGGLSAGLAGGLEG